VPKDTPFDPTYDKRCTVYAIHQGRNKNTGTFSCKERNLNETLELLRTMVYGERLAVPAWGARMACYMHANLCARQWA